MPAMDPYVVREGDHLKALANSMGFVADKVWNDPKNAALKSLRKTYNVLLEGDVLYVPPKVRKFLPVKIGQINSFTGKIVTCKISHVFAVDEQPLANTKFEVLCGVGGPPVAPPGTTDADGTASFEVPVDTRTVTVVFETGRTFRLGIGHLDPVDSPSGVVQRLRHLGYLALQRPTELDEVTSDGWIALAVRAFQVDSGLPATGVLDDATTTKLAGSFGI
jgi:hypothetical protein